MTYIRNNKTLVFIIGVLLLSNIALLYFFVNRCDKNSSKKDGEPRTRRQYMVETLKNDVGFNDDQIAQYEQLSNKHKEGIKPLFEEIKLTKDSLYSLLMAPGTPDSTVNYYLDMIGEKQRSIDHKIFSHFTSLRQICTEEQRPKFDTTMQGILRKMIGFKKDSSKDKQ